MREIKDHVKTSITLKENVLKLVLTNANHIYVEAEDGWLYRARRYRLAVHAIFDGTAWILQPDLGSAAVFCPGSTDAGQRTMTEAMLLSLNTVVNDREWFTKLRAQAEEVNANNEIERAERQIKELEEKLFFLKSKVNSLELIESLAQMGTFPKTYVRE